jgi:hypothetical protein
LGKGVADKKIKVASRSVRAVKVRTKTPRPKVPVPIVGTAIDVRSARRLQREIDGRERALDMLNDLGHEPDREPVDPAEVYGILGPPPSIAKKLNRSKISFEGLLEPEPEQVQHAKVSSHVIDPNELTPDELARYERLIEKANQQQTALSHAPVPNVESKAEDTK